MEGKETNKNNPGECQNFQISFRKRESSLLKLGESGADLQIQHEMDFKNNLHLFNCPDGDLPNII